MRSEGTSDRVVRSSPVWAWVLFGVASCGYQAPLLDLPPPDNVIAGEVVVSGVDEPANVVVLLFDAADPGPPAGTGSPLTFTTVAADAFHGQADGLQGAPYTFTGIPDGTYLVQGLMDRDGDFNPFEGTLAGSTCGDVVGGHLDDVVAQQLAPVRVEGGQLLDGIPLLLALQVPFERPAFALDGASVSQSAAADPLTPQTFTLAATAVHTAFGEDLPLDLDGPCVPVPDSPLCDPTQLQPCQTALWVNVRDGDADGVPDLRPEGIPDVWPRVYLQLIDDSLEPGEAWSAEALPLGAELGAMALGAPAPVPFGQPVPLGQLSVTWLPVAVHTLPDGTEERVDLREGGAIPTGAWAVTVVLESGQTWTVPNTLAEIGVSTQPDRFDPTTQGQVLVIEP